MVDISGRFNMITNCDADFKENNVNQTNIWAIKPKKTWVHVS